MFPDTVKVTHTRKETSISSALETQQFMFEYRILLVFDRLAQRLHATSLRITGLEFGAKASPDFRLAMGQVPLLRGLTCRVHSLCPVYAETWPWKLACLKNVFVVMPA